MSVSHNCFFSMSQQKLDILTSSLGSCGKSLGKKQRCRHGNYVFSCQYVVSQNETDAICDIRKAGAAHSSKDGNCWSQYGMVYWISQCTQAELVLCSVILLCSGFQSSPFRYISSTHRPYLCRQLKHSCTRLKASTFIKTTVVLLTHLKFIQAKNL